MDIHQLSVDYVEEQDRLLLRINTSQGEELRFWLTRRMLLKLWPTYKKVVAEHILRHGCGLGSHTVPFGSMDDASKAMLADFSRKEALQQADFETPYVNNPASLPLGEHPLLVTEVKLAPTDNGQLQIQLSEQVPGTAIQRSCQIDLTPQLTHGLTHLLEKSLIRCGWTEAAVWESALESSGEPAEPQEVDRPKYLN